MTTTYAADTLAATMHSAYFDDTAAALDTYLACTPNDNPTLPLRDRLILALDFDIADLLHNGNLPDLIPDAMLFSNEEYDALELRLLDNDDFLAPLADLILADHTNE